MSEPVNGDELLARIKPQLRTIRTQVCLRPDLLEAHEDAVAELDKAEDAGTERLNGAKAKAVKKLQDRVQAIEDEIDEVSPWFVFKAMPIEKYQALVAQHPPRPDNQMDIYYGHDRDAVVNQLVRLCMVDPVFSDEGWAEFLETCAPSEWGALRDVAVEVNGGSVKPPKLRRGSRTAREPVNVSE